MRLRQRYAGSSAAIGVLVMLVVYACGDDGMGPDGSSSDGGPIPSSDQCLELGVGREVPPCFNRIDDEDTWSQTSWFGATKFVAPFTRSTQPPSGLEDVAYLHGEEFQIHACFLTEFFSDIVGVLPDCENGIFDPETFEMLFSGPDRRFTSGYVEDIELRGERVFAFDIYSRARGEEARQELVEIYETLDRTIDLARLVYRPQGIERIEEALTWDVPFEVVPFEAVYVGYSRGRGCGYVRKSRACGHQDRRHVDTQIARMWTPRSGMWTPRSRAWTPRSRACGH